jgi:hypothetical protein
MAFLRNLQEFMRKPNMDGKFCLALQSRLKVMVKLRSHKRSNLLILIAPIFSPASEKENSEDDIKVEKKRKSSKSTNKSL